MKRTGPKKGTTRELKPTAARDVLTANVILRSATGKSVAAARPTVGPRIIKEYLPNRGMLEEARRLLTTLGFEINLVAPTHIAIAGRKELFEKTFHVRLEQKFAPYLQSSKGRSRGPSTQSYYVADVAPTIPSILATVVEMLEFPGPVTYFVSATPPSLSYYHLEVPNHVAQGMDALKAHDSGFTGKGINLAMVDSGFMTPFHPYYLSQGYDIQPLVPELTGFPHDDILLGHGTGIAACALAVAPGVTFTPYQIYSDPALAFARASMDDPDIITCSWGTSYNFALFFSIYHAVAKGIVVCFACGNEGILGWPGSMPAVISVGGTYLHEDGSIEASNYASSGISPLNPGRQVPDLCGIVGMAPHGVFIALPTEPGSLLDHAFGCDNADDYPPEAGLSCDVVDGTEPDDGWLVASGTSSAGPMVAATAALIMHGNPAIKGDPEAVRAALVKSCKDVTAGTSASGQAAGPGTDLATGAGLVQAYEAVKDYPIPMDTSFEVSVDPLAVLLGNELYAKLKKPYPVLNDALEDRMREVAQGLSSKKREQALARVKVLDDYLHATRRALSER
jgi:subtilisin family serine protease